MKLLILRLRRAPEPGNALGVAAAWRFFNKIGLDISGKGHEVLFTIASRKRGSHDVPHVYDLQRIVAADTKLDECETFRPHCLFREYLQTYWSEVFVSGKGGSPEDIARFFQSLCVLRNRHQTRKGHTLLWELVFSEALRHSEATTLTFPYSPLEECSETMPLEKATSVVISMCAILAPDDRCLKACIWAAIERGHVALFKGLMEIAGNPWRLRHRRTDLNMIEFGFKNTKNCDMIRHLVEMSPAIWPNTAAPAVQRCLELAVESRNSRALHLLLSQTLHLKFDLTNRSNALSLLSKLCSAPVSADCLCVYLWHFRWQLSQSSSVEQTWQDIFVEMKSSMASDRFPGTHIAKDFSSKFVEAELDEPHYPPVSPGTVDLIRQFFLHRIEHTIFG